MVGKDLLEAILEHLSDGVYFVDTNRVISYWNKGAERITGFKASEVIGRRCADRGEDFGFIDLADDFKLHA